MTDKTREPAAEDGESTYEPPELVVLGSVVKLTAVEGSLDESDRLLKVNVESVDRPLERLRAIRTC